MPQRIRRLLVWAGTRLRRLPWRSGVAVGLLVGGGYLAMLYGHTHTNIRLDVNGLSLVHSTQRRAGEDILAELAVQLGPADSVQVPSDEDLIVGVPIRLRIATPVMVQHDRRLSTVYMHGGDLASALAEAGIALSEGDELWTPGGRLEPNEPLPEIRPLRRVTLASWIDQVRQPRYVAIVRAARITVVDEGRVTLLTTTASTVAEALQRASVRIYEGDRVLPALSSPVSPDLEVEIQRALRVTIAADGRTRTVRTQAAVVSELLAEAGLHLEDDDRVDPDPATPVRSDMRVSVVRVYDEYYVEEVPIPYETRWEPNPELEIDQKRTANWGREGALRRQVRVHYEDGVEVSRAEEEAWVARDPQARIIQYGTGIIVRQIDTPSGTLEYWRKIRMLATSYNAATAGTPLSSAHFGLTRLGEPARKGVIAVDPTVIPMRQNMYVPGYGVGYAGDTGSAIKNRRIDLCFDDHNLEMWYRWVDVYLLTPVPPASQIAWILPNTPVERE